jgi:hypothetical protein
VRRGGAHSESCEAPGFDTPGASAWFSSISVAVRRTALAVVISVGCTAEATRPAAAVAASVAVVPTASVPATPTEPPPELLALREARRLFAAKEHAAAWRTIEPVAHVARSDGGLVCEAGYIAFHAGQSVSARQLIGRGIALLARDTTEQGRKRRAMCLYNLALVQEAEGTLGEAICTLRRSHALRPNRTVATRQATLEAKVNAAQFPCEASRVAGQRDVRALALEYAAADKLQISRIDREELGEFTLHTVHLEQGEVPEDELVRFSDAHYVIVDHGGALAPLGVLSFVDESVTYFKSGGGFAALGVHPSPLGTLLMIKLETWYRGDSEKTTAGGGTATHANSSLLVCRWLAEAGELVCAQVPLEQRETAEGGSGEGEKERAWGVTVTHAYDEAAGVFVFEASPDSKQTAEDIGLPIGRVAVAEVFERFPADSVGLAL